MTDICIWYIYIYIYIYICISLSLSLSLCVYTYIYIYICIRIYVYQRVADYAGQLGSYRGHIAAGKPFDAWFHVVRDK